ncbi:MAG: pyridoxal phosphate-dependent aminotransferase [Synergistaceae bacterium]|nr:pyridoxal phosphate-dependent aminotransferase [Synergistaceae bacterium]
MTYDFDRVIERRNTNSSKWDSVPGADIGVNYPVGEVLPLWVADMDFRAAPEIVEALSDVVKRGIFGYPIVPESCYDAIVAWMEKRHGWHIERDWILMAPGAVPAAHMAVQAYCQPGDRVLLQRPVYYPFFRTIFNNGGQIANSPLKIAGDSYEIDFGDFERQAANPRTTFFILCNPHNPVGRVWRREELERMGEICAAHDVLVLADELHCDIVMPGYKHTPFAGISPALRDNSVTVLAPSKTFNLAGLVGTVVVIPNRRLRRRFENILIQNSISRPNMFAIVAMEAAYRHGEKWFDEVLKYIHGNYEFMVSYLKENLPAVKPFRLEGTYLAWLDFRALETNPDKLQKRMLTEAKVWLDEGKIFGPEGNGFERIVLACPRSILQDALDRVAGVFRNS